MDTTLRRSRTDKVISGVCGGLARRLGADAAVVRLIFLASIFFFCGSALMFVGGAHQIALQLLLFSGLSFCLSPVVYVTLWIAMPQEPPAHSFSAPQGMLPVAAPQQTPYNPTREWEFDPYTGKPIDKY